LYIFIADYTTKNQILKEILPFFRLFRSENFDFICQEWAIILEINFSGDIKCKLHKEHDSIRDSASFPGRAM